MRFTVGGRELEIDQERVLRAMKGKFPEIAREHVVEIAGVSFPPKQVLSTVTGWSRQSFTTMEAQRVLTKLAFSCRRVGQPPNGGTGRATIVDDDGDRIGRLESALAAAESAIVTCQTAIAGLATRLDLIERRY